MATNDEEYRPEPYYIPQNFKDAGGVLGGRLGKRNAVELLVVCGPLAYLEYHLLPILNLSMQMMIIIAMVTIIPIAFVCAFGIGGESVSQLTVAWIRFRKKRRKLRYMEFSSEAKNKSMQRKSDKFFEDLGTFGLVKAISNLTDGNASAASDADRFDKKSSSENEVEDEQRSSKFASIKRGFAKAFDDRDEDEYSESYDAPTYNDYDTDERYEDDYEVPSYEDRPFRAEKRKPEPEYRPQKTSQPRAKKRAASGWLISASTKELLLRKLELGDDDDFD